MSRQVGLDELPAVLGRVGSAPTLDAALRALVSGAITLLQADEGLIRAYRAGPEDEDLTIHLRADSTEIPVMTGKALPGTIGAELQAGGPAILIRDYWSCDPAKLPIYDQLRSQNIRASVAVSLDLAGHQVGILHIGHHLPDYFTTDDLRIAETLAAHTAAILERARLEDARRRADAAYSRLDGALLVARTVAHEINNALSPVVGYAELLSVHPAVAADPTACKYAQLIVEAGDQVAQKVHRLERIVRLEERPSVLGPDRPLLDLDRSSSSS